MPHLHIGLDFDGVISDCGKLKSEAALRLYGLDIRADEFKKELVVERGLMTMKQYRDLQHGIYATREHGLAAAPVSGVKEAIASLQDEGHRLRVITSREGEALAIAKEWMDAHGIGLDVTGVGYGVSKARAAEGCDVYVDDDLDKLEGLVGVVPHLYLFSWGYNRHIDASAVARRVASWNHLRAEIADVARRLNPLSPANP